MRTINALRAAIKPLGFTVHTKLLSWGDHATYKHIASGQRLTFDVCDQATVERWQPLMQWIQDHPQELAELKGHAGIFGLKPSPPKAITEAIP